jgi:hypothetical protein
VLIFFSQPLNKSLVVAKDFFSWLSMLFFILCFLTEKREEKTESEKREV